MDHRNQNHVFTGIGLKLIVLAQATVTPKPTKGSFHNPTSWEELKARDVFTSFDDFQQPTANRFYPFNQLPGIGAVGPNQLQSQTFASDFLEHQLGTVAVLEVRGMDHYRQQQPDGVYKDMTFTAIDLFPRIIPMRPPFSVVFTDWLSTIPAEGSALRPARKRTRRRNAL